MLKNDVGGSDIGSKDGEWRSFRRGLFYFALASSLVWMVLDAIYIELPYARRGSEIVTNAKRAYSLSHPLFDPDATIRILVFGNSKMLAGFNPSIFDANLALDGVSGKVQSINEGLPGDDRFVVYLAQLLEAGVRPTHVLAQSGPVSDDHELILREWLRHDKMIVDTLFPFRSLPRDLSLFLFAAAKRGSVAESYRDNQRVAEQLMRDGGFYFLKGESHYPNDSLPDDYSVPKDSPDSSYVRPIDTALPAFQRLEALSHRYGFRVIYIPPPYRMGELAPAASRNPVIESLAEHPDFTVLGEDYWLLPPRNFSDPGHLNPRGAAIYSERLAKLVAPLLKEGH